MMGALVEVDGARVARYAREHNLATEDALPALLDETAAGAEQAGRDGSRPAGRTSFTRVPMSTGIDRRR